MGQQVIATLGIGVEIDATAAAIANANVAGKNLGQAVESGMQVGAAGMGGLSKATDQYTMTVRTAEAAAQKLRDAIDPLAPIQRRFNAEVGKYNELAARGKITSQELAQAEALATAKREQAISRTQQLTKVTGEQRAGMQQLSFQIGDVAQQFALGTPPQIIFAQQSGQVIQAVQMMSGGTSRLAAFLGGPWGVAIAAATVVLSPFIGKLFDTKDAADAATNALQRLIERRRQEVAEALTLGKAEMSLNENLAKQAKLIDSIKQRTRGIQPGGIDYTGKALPGKAPQFAVQQFNELKALRDAEAEARAAIADELDRTLQDTRRETQAKIEAQAKVDGAVSASEKVQARYNQRVREARDAYENSAQGAAEQAAYQAQLTSAEKEYNQAREAGRANRSDRAAQSRIETLAREAASIETLIAGLYKAVAAYGVSAAAGRKAELEAEAMAKGMRKQADVADYTAQQLRKAVAEQVAEQARAIRQMAGQTDAQEQVNKAVLSGALAAEDAADALAMLNEQRALTDTIKLAELNNDAKGAEAARLALAALNDEQLRALKIRKEAEDIQATAQTNRNIDQIQKETALQKKVGEERMKALRGLSGDALENELARISVEYEKQNILLQAQAAAARESALGHYENAKAILAEANAQAGQVGQAGGQASAERELEQNRQRAIDTAHEIADIIGGRIGRAIGDLADALAEFDKLTGGKGLEKVGKALGISGLGDAVKAMGVGARFGGAVDGVFDAIGIKSSKAGAQIGGALGQFAGPLGMIAGSILGGIVGGMMKSTPRASATVSVIAGEAMDVAIKGSSGKLKAMAGAMADSVIGGLADLASALGADLVGNASVSIGMRNDKYRVDTTGSGITKTSKGAVDFGEDKAAAIAFALQDAIKDGVLGGLSASLEKLITGDGDLQVQLQKALNFKGVFDELAKRDDPAAFAQAEVGRWRAGMDKVFAEAGATAEELAALERLTGIKRAEAAEEAAKTVQAALRESLERENALQSKRVELLELQGKAAEALALSRQIELSTMTEAEAVIQRQIHAEQDLADTRSAALAKWESEYQTARGLIDALRIQEGGLAVQRQIELMQIPPHLRYLKELYWAREDEAKAAEETAIRLKAIADERYGLETRYLQLIGDTAKLRERELAALDPANRAYLKRIFDEEDRQAREDAAAKAAEEARQQRISALESEASALEQAAERYRQFAKTIREFRDGLAVGANPAAGYGALRSQFNATAGMAALGNEASLGAFTGDAKAFLDASLAGATSSLEHQRNLALVRVAADAAIGGADGMASAFDAQIGALNAQIAATEAVGASTDVVASLVAGMGQQASEELFPELENTIAGGNDELVTLLKRNRMEEATEAEDMRALVETLLIKVDRLEASVGSVIEGDAFVVTARDSLPVTGSVTARVTNSGAAEAVPVNTTP